MRRAGLLISVAAGALAPVLAAPLFASEAAPTPTARFAPTNAPLVLTRSVIRILRDGKQIVVRRSYAVRFTREGAGYLVEGYPLSVEVDAPPVLAPLAAIERQRVDPGPFPIRLDGKGRIIDLTASGAPAGGQEALVAQAQAMLGAARLDPREQTEASAFIARIAANGASAPWPVDLFNPVAPESSGRSTIDLPGGQQGTVEVRIGVSGYLPCGLPSAVERKVTTTIAGTSRLSREQWSLTPALGV